MFIFHSFWDSKWQSDLCHNDSMSSTVSAQMCISKLIIRGMVILLCQEKLCLAVAAEFRISLRDGDPTACTPNAQMFFCIVTNQVYFSSELSQSKGIIKLRYSLKGVRTTILPSTGSIVDFKFHWKFGQSG